MELLRWLALIYGLIAVWGLAWCLGILATRLLP
jgi:hypothetical protein